MKRLRYPSIVLFLTVQAALYLLFLYGDLAGAEEWTIPVKYVSILLCCFFSVYWRLHGGDKLVTVALAFTLGADTFLLLLNRGYWLGILLFCVVQALYLLRIIRANGGHTRWLTRLYLFIIALLVLKGMGLLTLLNVLALFYFTNFLCNTVQSLALPRGRLRLFSLGLVLFLCCDVCVGAFNLPGMMPDAVYSFARVGMWLFYLPAQVLITLSGLPDSVLRGLVHENQ